MVPLEVTLHESGQVVPVVRHYPSGQGEAGAT